MIILWEEVRRHDQIINSPGNTPKLICACRKSKALVMEYLSESLSHQFEKCQYKLSLKSCLMLAINMVCFSF